MTATKPSLPLPAVVELYAASAWQDVTTDVYQRQAVTVNQGLPNETASSNPFQATMVLDNRPQAQYGNRGRYDPDNPNSDLYGTLGRNTLIRCCISAEQDTFTRTTSNGWGTSDSGDAWSTAWTGAGNSASSFAVGSGTGTHANANGNAYLLSYTTNTYTDVDVALTCSVLNGTSITGGQIEPLNVLLRGSSTTAYYMLRCTVQTSGAVTLQWLDSLSVVITSAVTATVTHSATSLRVRAQVEGQTLRAKVWDPAGAEPSGWLVTGNYMDAVVSSGARQWDTAGWVGVRSGVSSGNTNAKPITFSYDNLVVRVPRFAGWLATLEPTETDVSGLDKVANVTVAGILRQLAQSAQVPLQSALRHDIPFLSSLIAYWPCEDKSPSTQFASGLRSGGRPMNFDVAPAFASDSTFVGSAPLPVSNGTYWLGYTSSPPANGVFQVRALLKFPVAGTLVDQTVLMRVHTNGTMVRWDLVYGAGGSLAINGYAKDGTVVAAMGASGFNVDGQALRLSMWAQQSGGNITGQTSSLVLGSGNSASYVNWTTVTSQTLTNCYAVAVCPPGNNISTTVVGHITVESAVTDIFALAQQFNGFVGERTVARLARLCGYIGVELDYIGDPTARDQTLGIQPIDTPYNVIQQCAVSDGGLLYEAKGAPALVYRTSGAHQAQTSVITLDRASHQLGDVVPKIVDDLTLRNDVTATRVNGSSYEATQTTGALSTQQPPNGVGVYPIQIATNLQTDSQLPDAASWALHLGTVPDPRIPSVTVNLSSVEITAAMYWQAMAIAPDTAVNVTGQNPDTLYLLARGYTETFGGMRPHVMQLNTAPGAPYHGAVCDDGGVSRLGSDGSTLGSGVNTTATSLSVAITDTGTLWTTTAGDFPFDVTVDGERMTVTNITGSSSPQTFTVTRSVNGIVKSHNSGAKVTLIYPVYLGYGSL